MNADQNEARCARLRYTGFSSPCPLYLCGEPINLVGCAVHTVLGKPRLWRFSPQRARGPGTGFGRNHLSLKQDLRIPLLARWNSGGSLAPTLGDRLQQDRTTAAILTVARSDDAAVVVQVRDEESRYAFEVSVERDPPANRVPEVGLHRVG